MGMYKPSVVLAGVSEIGLRAGSRGPATETDGVEVTKAAPRTNAIVFKPFTN
jgi:hypothetical protein